MSTKFPDAVYVTIEDPGTDEEWLNTHRTAEKHYDPDGPVRVGVYKLIDVVEVTMKVETTSIS